MHLIRKRDIETDNSRDSFGRVMAKHKSKLEEQSALVERSRILKPFYIELLS